MRHLIPIGSADEAGVNTSKISLALSIDLVGEDV